MLQYQGSSIYKFWNEKNETLLLSQADIQVISDFAEKDPTFTHGENLKNAVLDSEFWRNNYRELAENIKDVYYDVSNNL